MRPYRGLTILNPAILMLNLVILLPNLVILMFNLAIMLLYLVMRILRCWARLCRGPVVRWCSGAMDRAFYAILCNSMQIDGIYAEIYAKMN